MSHSVNLGRACFQTVESPLQLQLTATADFTSLVDSPIQIPQFGMIQLPRLLAAWVTEAPELELRLHVNINPCLEWTLFKFISSLGERVCSSKVWSDLGFAIVFKSCESSENISSTARQMSCLTFGLSRLIQSPNQVRNRRVPLILRNPAVGHPPTGYPSVFLSAIDIHLEYFFRVHSSFQQEWGSEEIEILRSLELLHFEELLDSNCQWGHSVVGSTEIYIPALAEGDLEKFKLEPPEKFLNELEVGDAVLPFKNLPVGHTGNFGNISESNFPQTSDSDESILQEFQHCQVETSTNFRNESDSDDLESSLPVFFRLLNTGLTGLMLPVKPRLSESRSVPGSNLENMPNLAPAVFVPCYRSAMDQRAVSIPIISRAINLMVEGSQNHEVKRISATLSRNFDEPAPTTPTVGPSSRKGLNNAIQSSLWGIAQAQLRRAKGINMPTSFFEESHVLNDTNDMGFNMLVDSNSNYDDGHVDFDDFHQIDCVDLHSPVENIWPNEWMEDLDDEICSERSLFECISESGPNSMDTTSTSICTNLLSALDEFEVSQSPCSFSGMLICDSDEESNEGAYKEVSDLLCRF